MKPEVRVRFAPSPTGALHIGGVRTALYNYLFAKKMGGKMILRIEDTDQNRFIPGAEDYINEALDWVGIIPDEGVLQGGENGPYRQSERKHIYMKYANKLVEEGNAYYAFDTPEELDIMREKLKSAKLDSLQYNAITRQTMKNSLTLSELEVKERIASGEPYVIRLKVPKKEEVRLNDSVRGWVMVHSSVIDDKVLMKSDGMPTYHLANIVDDHLMNISHVIRGEEWLPSAPLHVLLYKFLGWEETMPKFAHLPLLLKPDGNGKLSKRDADKHGFPVFPLAWKDPETGEEVMGFREQGYLADAFRNFISFLGWNPGTTQELFSLDNLIEAFTIERIGKAGAKFDINKAIWYNQQYIKEKSDQELAIYLLKDLEKAEIPCSPEKASAVCNLMKERVSFVHDFLKDGKYFFIAPETYDSNIIKNKWTHEAVYILGEFRDAISESEDFNEVIALNQLKQVLNKNNVKIGKVMQALRLAITGVATGPDLMRIMAIIGKEQTVNRINHALNTINVT
jgi:glutamyl-tRNA synthetase